MKRRRRVCPDVIASLPEEGGVRRRRRWLELDGVAMKGVVPAEDQARSCHRQADLLSSMGPVEALPLRPG